MGDGHVQGSSISYARWHAELPRLRARYAEAEPFPHIVLDEFIQPEIAEQALREFPGLDSSGWIHHKHFNENKLDNPDRSTFGPTLGAIIDELNASAFLRFLSDLTGVQELRPDTGLQGGGLHLSGPGGFLNIHADFTVHPYRRNWRRRINVLIYLNKQWEDHYRGHLELWDSRMQRCVRMIAPLFNRAVIFNTDAVSFHGHPDPLTCPPEFTRKSLALYYYTQESRPPDVRSTHYRARPGDGLKALWIHLDNMALRLYTATKWRFGISDRVASRMLRFLSRLRPY